MIEISPDTACLLYIGGLLIGLIALWWRWSMKWKRRDISKLQVRKLTCELCKSNYLDESFTEFHRCPICGCLNTSTLEPK